VSTKAQPLPACEAAPQPAVSARAEPMLAPERSLVPSRSGRLAVGAPDDPLEREAERVASALVQRRTPIPRTSPGTAVLRRQGPGEAAKRAEPGRSGSIKTGKLARWEYVVYPDHVRLGNRVFAPGQVIGSWPWMTNNPGDITVDLSKPKDRPEERRAFGWGAYRGKAASTGHVLLAIFPDVTTGMVALQHLLTEPGYAGLTIAQAVNKHLGRPESRMPGVDDPAKYARLVQEKLDKSYQLGAIPVKVNVYTDRLADLAARGLIWPVVQGFGRAEGAENVGVTYRCSGRDKTDDEKIPQTVRNLRVFKDLPDEAPAEISDLLGCPLGVQRFAADGGGPVAAPPIVQSVLASPGRGLEPRVRDFFEPRFGRDFGQVRIHADAAAAESAAAVGAHAYAVASHLVFGAGRYRPESADGRRLLAHELAHVVQQSGGSSDGELAEERARAAGRHVAAGGAVSPSRLGGAPISIQRADPEEEQKRPPGWTLPPVSPDTQTLESFDVDPGPGRKPWNLNLLSRKIAAGLAGSKEAWLEVVGYYDPAADAAAGVAGAQVAAAKRRVDVVQRALIQWAVPAGRLRTSIIDTSVGDPRLLGAERRQVDVVLHSAPAAAAPSVAQPAMSLVIVVPSVPEEAPTAGKIFREPPPPIVLDAPASLTGALLRQIGKDVNKLLDTPIALGAGWVVDQLPAEWEVRKKLKKALREVDKPGKAPPLTDVGTFADPRFRDIAGEQAAAREAMTTTVAKAILFAGQTAIPAPPRDPLGTTFFIRLPGIPLP
jgi:Domain of unknown function (DUF4157)